MLEILIYASSVKLTGATYIARSTVAHYKKHLVNSIKQAFDKKGILCNRSFKTPCPVQFGRRNSLRKPFLTCDKSLEKKSKWKKAG